MNKFEKFSFGLAVLLTISFVALATENPELENGLKDDRHVVEVMVDGKQFRAPVNENIEVSEARRQFDMETISNLFQKISAMFDLIFVKKAGHMKVAKTALSIVPQAMKNARKLKELRKTDTTPPTAHGYANKMGDLIVEIAQIRTPERIEGPEAKQRADNIIEAIRKMSQESSTGLYLDWTKFTADGEPLTHYLAPVLQWFRDNGYGWELRLFDGLAAVVKSFSI